MLYILLFSSALSNPTVDIYDEEVSGGTTLEWPSSRPNTWQFECTNNQAFDWWRTRYHSSNKDRTHKFGCSSYTDQPSYSSAEEWSAWTNYKGNFNHNCRTHTNVETPFMCGVSSQRNSNLKDRKYSFLCCGADGASEITTVSECEWTPWSTEAESHVWSYWPKHVTAINSRWIGGNKKDRKWRLQVCRSNQVPLNQNQLYSPPSNMYVNGRKEHLNFECPRNTMAIVNMESDYHSGSDDRKWKFTCDYYTSSYYGKSQWYGPYPVGYGIANLAGGNGAWFVCGLQSYHTSAGRTWFIKFCTADGAFKDLSEDSCVDRHVTQGNDKVYDPIGQVYPKRFLKAVIELNRVSSPKDDTWIFRYCRSKVHQEYCAYEIRDVEIRERRPELEPQPTIPGESTCGDDACNDIECHDATCATSIEISSSMEKSMTVDYEKTVCHAHTWGTEIVITYFNGPVAQSFSYTRGLETCRTHGQSDTATTTETVSQTCEGEVTAANLFSVTLNIEHSIEERKYDWVGTLYGARCVDGIVPDTPVFEDEAIGPVDGIITSLVSSCVIDADYGNSDFWEVRKHGICGQNYEITNEFDCESAAMSLSVDTNDFSGVQPDNGGPFGGNVHNPTGCYASGEHVYFNDPSGDNRNGGSCSSEDPCICRTHTGFCLSEPYTTSGFCESSHYMGNSGRQEFFEDHEHLEDCRNLCLGEDFCRQYVWNEAQRICVLSNSCTPDQAAPISQNPGWQSVFLRDDPSCIKSCMQETDLGEGRTCLRSHRYRTIEGISQDQCESECLNDDICTHVYYNSQQHCHLHNGCSGTRSVSIAGITLENSCADDSNTRRTLLGRLLE